MLQNNCKNTIFAIKDPDRIIVASGLEDFIVADAGNAILICPLEEEQRIRQAVNDVKDRFGPNYI